MPVDDKDKDIINRLPGDLTKVAGLIGLEAAFRLVEGFGGTYISVPKCEGLLREIRNNEILRLYDTGEYTRRDLALKFNLTTRQIDNVLNQARTDVPPPLLKLMEKSGL